MKDHTLYALSRKYQPNFMAKYEILSAEQEGRLTPV